MLCWRFPRGGAQQQEPEPSSYLWGLVASWPSRRCSLAPSSLGTGQDARCRSGGMGDVREMTVLVEMEDEGTRGQGEDDVGGYRGHRELDVSEDLGWLMGRRRGIGI